MELSVNETTLDLLKNLGVGIRPIHDPFFDESYRVCKVFRRTGIIIEDNEALCHPMMKEFVCNDPGCRATFDNLLNFEIHYNSTHRFACSECKKIKPNARLLEIHIEENHDHFFKILSEKQPMHRCYVSDCDIKFATPELRKEHCIHVHKFPKTYKYDENTHQKDNKKNTSETAMEIEESKTYSVLRKPKLNLNKNQRTKMFSSNTEASCNATKTIANECLDKVIPPQPISSSLVFIPRQLTLSKVLTQGKSMTRKVLETDSLMELASTLPT